MARLCARSGPSRTRLENGRCEPVGVDGLEALDNVVFIDEEDSEHERPLLARSRIRAVAGIIGCLTLATPAVPAPTEPGRACWTPLVPAAPVSARWQNRFGNEAK